MEAENVRFYILIMHVHKHLFDGDQSPKKGAI